MRFDQDVEKDADAKAKRNGAMARMNYATVQENWKMMGISDHRTCRHVHQWVHRHESFLLWPLVAVPRAHWHTMVQGNSIRHPETKWPGRWGMNEPSQGNIDGCADCTKIRVCR
jgi:hypothetical protein